MPSFLSDEDLGDDVIPSMGQVTPGMASPEPTGYVWRITTVAGLDSLAAAGILAKSGTWMLVSPELDFELRLLQAAQPDGLPFMGQVQDWRRP